MSKKLNRIFFLLMVITLTAPRFVFAQFATQKFDDRTLIDLQDNRTPEQTSFFLFMSNTNQYVDVGVPVALLAGGIIGHNEAMRQNSLYIASSSALTYGLTYLIKHIVKRPRPFIQNINIVPVYRASGTSFPSGHTSSSFATATALSIAYPKWYVIGPSFLWAGTVSYSRMYLGEHYPSDVAAGALLGAGSAVSLMFIKK
ncbi:phosphatase PAP2 family protein [Mucilaginibacter sp. X4EP1]|uniref:phosphatase PAP2 family protein n=1 Tax=Mucilaginibacter sp. X4EP1 TaxID=2723092 RepID=UPI00216A9ACD|nr:phosphatase PAP2 family protein [Mucilaginibacter sp. X4EP1]MCS3813568.1 undecaprenyl-diphosphatase [Mucilaginibacter sp. X4EP1]